MCIARTKLHIIHSYCTKTQNQNHIAIFVEKSVAERVYARIFIFDLPFILLCLQLHRRGKVKVEKFLASSIIIYRTSYLFSLLIFFLYGLGFFWDCSRNHNSASIIFYLNKNCISVKLLKINWKFPIKVIDIF